VGGLVIFVAGKVRRGIGWGGFWVKVGTWVDDWHLVTELEVLGHEHGICGCWISSGCG
jgi:hypothetical protein